MRWASSFFMGAILSAAAEASGIEPIDRQATLETKALLANLKRVSRERVLFGHQHTTCYGVGWKNDSMRSDVKDVTGSFPAVYGWDWGHIGTKNHGELIVEAFERGGINTMSWHAPNIAFGGRSWDTTPGSVAAILPGGEHHGRLKENLDKIALFASSARDRRGRLVPIIFRPWHEHTGNWFWWGTKACSPDEYIALWRFTLEYLRDEKGVRNLLWAYSPSHVGIEVDTDYETNRFPGYEYIDILGIDVYVKEDSEKLIELCGVVARLADKHGKVAALTEFGYANGLHNSLRNDWYTTRLLQPLKRNRDAGGIAYALTWRNDNPKHFWVPYRGHPAATDFKKFYADPMTVFEDKLPDMYRFYNHGREK